MKHDSDSSIQEQTNRALNRQTATLPTATRQRLADARQRALRAGRKPWYWQPQFATACSVLVLTLVWWQLPDTTHIEEQQLVSQHNEDAIDAFTYLTTLDETEQDIVADLEFAMWLSQQSELDHDLPERG